MNNTKILHLGMSPNKGGIEVLNIELFKELSKQDITFHYLTYHSEIAFEKEILNLGGVIHRIEVTTGIKSFYNNFKSYYTFFNNRDYNIVHNHLMNLRRIESIFAQKLNRVNNIILHSHGASAGNDLKTRILTKINRKIAWKFSNENIACSHEAANFMFGDNKGEIEKYIPFNNAINTKKFLFDATIRYDLKKKYGLDNKKVYGHIGRFDEVKNHIFLINIFNEILEKDNNSHLFLIGDGGLKQNCIELVKKLDIEDNVTFLGSVENVNYYLNVIDCIIHPSISEGLPMVIIEAQANGIPCFISDVITKEVQLTELVTKLSLSYSAREWATAITEERNYYNRKHYNEIVKIKGYEIKDVAQEYYRFYKSLDEN